MGKWFLQHIPILTILFCFFAASSIFILDHSNHDRFEKVTITLMDITSPALDPITHLFHDTSLVFHHMHRWVSQKKQIDLLTKQNELLKARLVRAEFIESENRSLRELLSIPSDPTFPFITARVVAVGQGSFIRTAIINAGNQAGITKGQVVTNHQGLVGRVTEVSQYASRVLLLTDMNSHIPVISSQSQERGILKGNNSENMTISFLTENHQLQEGELIFTSGDGDLFPPGILAGVVSEIHPHKAVIEPAVDWHQLQHIHVIQSLNTPK